MAAQQQGGQSDNSMGILWTIAAIFAVLGGIWYAFKSYLVTFYLTIKLYEANLLTLILGDSFNHIRDSIILGIANPQKLGFQEVVNLGDGVGDYLRFPIVIILVVLAVVVYFSNTTRMFKHNYNMKELAQLEKVNWPQITPVIHLDLLKTDIDKGPWSMAMKPIQFCKRFNLLEEVRPHRREGMSRKDWERIDVVLKKGMSNKLFALQLGPLWRGVDKLPPHTRALFAVFAARINADSKPAQELLYQFSASSTSRLNFKGVDELLKKHLNSKIVQEIIHSHAYVFTIMASMLERSRDDGVQASADFLWLKPLDRRLWYILNTVGRQTPFIEVAGIFAHWVAEKEAGRKLVVPMVEEATKALELALTEVVYNPDEY